MSAQSDYIALRVLDFRGDEAGALALFLDRMEQMGAKPAAGAVACSDCAAAVDRDGAICSICGHALCWRCLEMTDRRLIVRHLQRCFRSFCERLNRLAGPER